MPAAKIATSIFLSHKLFDDRINKNLALLAVQVVFWPILRRRMRWAMLTRLFPNPTGS